MNKVTKKLNEAVRMILRGRDRGLRALQQAESSAKAPREWMQIGDAWERSEMLQHAVLCFLRAGLAFSDEGFERHAVAMFRRVLDIEPDHPRARELLAESLERQGFEGAADEVRARTGHEACREEDVRERQYIGGGRWMAAPHMSFGG